MTIQFWAVFIDETGCEFGAGIEAETKAEAWNIAREDYPESRCVQMESPEDTAERERRMYERLNAEYDDGYYECDDYDEDDE